MCWDGICASSDSQKPWVRIQMHHFLTVDFRVPLLWASCLPSSKVGCRHHYFWRSKILGSAQHHIRFLVTLSHMIPTEVELCAKHLAQRLAHSLCSGPLSHLESFLLKDLDVWMNNVCELSFPSPSFYSSRLCLCLSLLSLFPQAR